MMHPFGPDLLDFLQLPKPLASTAVVAMGLLWATMGGGLLLATEFLANSTTKCAIENVDLSDS